MEYRTEEQFMEIIDSMTNGNWTQASKEIVEYGFYSGDIDEALFDYETKNGLDWKQMYEMAVDFIHAIEMATKLRMKGGE